MEAPAVENTNQTSEHTDRPRPSRNQGSSSDESNRNRDRAPNRKFNRHPRHGRKPHDKNRQRNANRDGNVSVTDEDSRKKHEEHNVDSNNKDAEDNVQSADNNNNDEDESASVGSGELCFICTEPIVAYAVAACDHRTCHLCALRLRALYKTRNCAYCKTHQDTVIFTKDPEKPFASYTQKDTPYVDKKLGLRFEDKQVYQDTMLLLQFNCPDPNCDVACDGGWPELKRHVKKAHDLFLCDLCTRHKKIFAHEHTLYTYSQLMKHCKTGDKAADETGFKGHPECYFCRVSFYGDDELFEHCRDKHEQCHICVRRGIRHQYYANYDRLEEHFRKEHYLCAYRECLDQKFVVFETDIDLKAHEVEVHGASISRLQRAKQNEARRVDVSFDYGGSRSQAQQHRSERVQTSAERNRGQRENGQSQHRETTSRPQLAEEDFPTIGSQRTEASSTSSQQQTRSTFKKPAGFGSLSDNWPTLGESSSSNAPPVASSSSSTPDREVVSRHAAFLERVFDMVKSHEKVSRFRALTTAYRNSNIDVDTYINEISNLCDGNVEHASKIVKGVEELMDNREKKSEIARAWRNKETMLQNFPVLESSSERSSAPAGHGTSPRVLVIKSRNTKAGGTRTTGKSKAGVWDRVASAASGASGGGPSQGSSQSSGPSSPGPIVFPTPQLNGTQTAWGGRSSSSSTKDDDFPSLAGSSNEHFPSLPSAPKNSLRISSRRNMVQPLHNAWGADRSVQEEPEPASDLADSGKKKKGKKNKQVLMRVGL